MHRPTRLPLRAPRSIALLLGCVPLVTGAAGVQEVIVTSTRVNQDPLTVPMAITAVEMDAIQSNQQLGLDEALGRVPGVFFQNRYNFAQDLRISIRGFGSRSNFGIRGIKLFVDGIPSTTTDGQGGVDDIDLGSTQRVEVIRGAASSLYGAAAGGVISLYTEDGPERPFVEAGLSLGEFDYQKYQVKAGGQTGRLNWLVNTSYMNMEGYRKHSWAQNGLINSKFRWDIDETSDLTVVVNAFDSPRADDPGGLSAAQVRTNRKQAFCNLNAFNDACRFASGEAIDQQKAGFVYRKEFNEQHQIVLRNYYVWRGFEGLQPFQASGYIEFDRFFYGGGAQYIWTGELYGHSNRLTFGVDLDEQEDDRQRYDNDFGVRGVQTLDQLEAADSQGVFVQNEFAILDNLLLTLGARYDMLDLSVEDRFLANGDQTAELEFDELSPMLGLMWSPLDELNLYTNYTSSFETPTFTELANPAQAGTLGGFANVTRQLAKTFEIGAKGNLGPRVIYDVAAYTTAVEDEITNVITEGSRAFFVNADTERRGVETAVGVNVFEGLDVTATYTFSDFEFDRFSRTPANEGNALPGVPEHQFYAVVNYRHPSGLYVNWDMLHVNRYWADNGNTAQNPSYQVANLRFGRPFVRGNVTFEPYVGLNNMFNEEYNGNVRLNAVAPPAPGATPRYFEPAPEKNVYGGIQVRYDFDS